MGERGYVVGWAGGLCGLGRLGRLGRLGEKGSRDGCLASGQTVDTAKHLGATNTPFLPSPILSYSHRDVQPKVPEQSGREVGGALEEDGAGAGGLPVGLEELLDLVETLPNAEGEGKGRERE